MERGLSTTGSFTGAWAYSFPVFLLVIAATVSAGDTDSCIEKYPRAPEFSQAATALMETLSSPPQAPGKRADTLRRGIEKLEREGSDSERRVLGNRARLVLGALALREGELSRARAWIDDIELATSAGVTAGLLRAEVALAADEPDRARQWYLRIGEHFPFHTEALGGLVRTANMLAAKERDEAALALYDKIIRRADRGVSQLHRASELFEAQGILVFLRRHDDIDAMLQRELALIGPGGDQDMLNAGMIAPRAKRQHECLVARHEVLQQQFQELDARQRELIESRARLERQISGHRQRLAGLEERVIPGDTSEEQNRIRQAVRQLGNAVHRKEARLSFIARNSERLSAVRAHVEVRFRDLLASVSGQVERSDVALEESFEAAIDEKSAQLRQIAGESYLGRAGVLERRAGLP